MFDCRCVQRVQSSARNGGHISPVLYHDYAIFCQDYGDVAAQKLMQFRLTHLQELRRAAEGEGVLDESQWRQVEAVDAYYHQELFEKAKAKVQTYHKALLPEASHYQVYESAEAIQVCVSVYYWRRTCDEMTCVEIQISVGRRRVYCF